MYWCRFESSGREAYGIVEDDRIVEVKGDPYRTYETTATRHFVADVKLLPPSLPSTIYAAGLNYPTRARSIAEQAGRKFKMPIQPHIGYRAVNALIGPNEPIVIPADASENVAHEGELVVVIGRKAKNVTKADAMDYVLGLTIGNDVSERRWQQEDETFWRAKNTDTFKPMGPWIATHLNPEDLQTTVRINGHEASHFDTGKMIFDIPTFISVMTRYLTLFPGDVIWMGSEGMSSNIQHGDVVEIEITDIGVLSNPVIKEGRQDHT